MNRVYIIKYINGYNHGNPWEPNIEIYEDLFFNDYETALNYAKLYLNKDDEFEIDTLNLGGNTNE